MHYIVCFLPISHKVVLSPSKLWASYSARIVLTQRQRRCTKCLNTVCGERVGGQVRARPPSRSAWSLSIEAAPRLLPRMQKTSLHRRLFHQSHARCNDDCAPLKCRTWNCETRNCRTEKISYKID